MNFYRQNLNLIKHMQLPLKKKVDFYGKLFDDVQDITNNRKTIDNTRKTEDIFTNDKLQTPNVPWAPDLTFDFSDVWLPKNKGKDKTAKKKVSRTRQNKNIIKKLKSDAIQNMKRSNYL